MDNDIFPIEQFINKVPIIRKEDFFPKEFFLLSKEHSQYIDKVVIPKGLIHDRVEKLAERILVDHHNEEVVFLVLLKGAIVFAQSLFEKIGSLLKSNAYSMKYKCEYISVARIGVENINRDIKIQEKEELFKSLKGKTVILVEDNIDTGLTLYKIINLLKKYEPLSIKCSILLRKMRPENLQYDYEIDYLGFLIPNNCRYFGFGNDIGDKFREIDHVCSPTDECLEKFQKKI